MAGVSPMSRRSRVSASHLALEEDCEFKLHKKFHTASPSFASNANRFKTLQSSTPGPNAYYAQPTTLKRKGATLGLTAGRSNSALRSVDRFYDTQRPGRSVKRESVHGSASFASTAAKGLRLPKDGVDPTRYSPDLALTRPAAKNTSSAAFRSGTARTCGVAVRDGPAPGAYGVVHSSASAAPVRATNGGASAAFRSRSPRLFNPGTGGAGPPQGTYETSGSTLGTKGGGAAAFRSRSPRMAPMRNSGTPAPGAYDAHDPGRQGTKVYSIAKSPRAKGIDDTLAPSVGVGLRRVSVRSATPGPGAYDAPHSTLSGKTPGTAALRSSSAKNTRARDNGVPGPGHHQIDHSSFRSGRSHSMRGAERFKPNFDNSPGPGAFIKTYSSFLN